MKNAPADPPGPQGNRPARRRRKQVLLGTFVLGALTGTLVCLLPLARTSLTARRYRRSIAGLEAEIHELRTLPLGPERAALGPDEDRMGLPPDVPAGRST